MSDEYKLTSISVNDDNPSKSNKELSILMKEYPNYEIISIFVNQHYKDVYNVLLKKKELGK